MRLTKICGFKLKKAQHIVELALLAPFIMFFVGIVYQIAITIHTNYIFNASLYEAINFMALTNKIIKDEDSSLNPTALKEQTVNNIKLYAQILLTERHAPSNDSLDIKLVNAGDVDFLIGMYRYTSTFKIFNHIENFNPEDYNYLTVIPVNSAILRRNSFKIPNDFFDLDYEIKPFISEDSTEESDTPPEDSESSSDETTDTPDTPAADDTSSDTHDIEIPEVSF